MNIKLDVGARIPHRAHPKDAGLDLFSRESGVVRAHSSRVFDTGVHIELPPNTAGLLVSKSGLYINHDITSTGLIDEEYVGSIKVGLYNGGDKAYKVEAGDKISQLVILPIIIPDELELVDELDDTERGANGFGSTGK